MRRRKTPSNEYFQYAHSRTTDYIFLLRPSHPLLALESQTLTSQNQSFGPTQADVKVFQATKTPPQVEKYPHAYRWYKHAASFESDFSSLPGDPSKAATAYGPEVTTLPINTKAPDADEDDDDDVDLFGSDDEDEDEEAEKLKAQRLEEYRQKKAGKEKPAAKSIVTLDVKPWGTYHFPLSSTFCILTFDRRRNRHERARGLRAQHRARRPRVGWL